MTQALKRRAWMFFLAAAGICAFGFLGVFATGNTYYVSSSAGSDSNTSAQAQSKTTPWAHVPTMPNATGNAAAYAPQPGDRFILKGGDVWTFAAGTQWVWTASGTSTNPITFTVDTTWFNSTNCGNWATVNTYATPPIRSDPSNVVLASATSYGLLPDLVGQSVTINGSSYTVSAIAFGGNEEAMTVTPAPPTATGVAMTTSGVWCQPKIDLAWTLTCNFPTQSGERCAGIDAANVSYVTFDDIDVGRYHPVNCNVGTCYRASAINVTPGSNSLPPGFKWTRNFFHDATAVGGTITSGSDNFGIGAAGDLVQGNTCSNQNNGLSYAAGGCFGAAGNGKILGNWCYRTNDCVDYGAPGVEAGYNTLYNGQDDTVDASDHGNAIHNLCPSGGGVHHNLIFDLSGTGQGMSAILEEPSGSFNSACPNTGSFTGNTWDNVLFNLGNQTCIEDRNGSHATVSYVHDGDSCVPPGGTLGTASGDAVRLVNDSNTGPQGVTIVNMHVLSAAWSGSTAPVSSASSTAGNLNPFYFRDSGVATPVTVTTSVPMSGSTAVSQGYATSFSANYTVITTNGFAPTAGTNATVGTGTNESSLCSGVLSSLCFAIDWFNPSAADGVGRPGTGNWNVGAQQLNTSASPTITISPTALGFGTVTLTSNLQKTISITNNSSSSAVSFTTKPISGTNAADFVLATDGCGASLAASGTCTLTLTFTPTVAPGSNETATLTLNDSAQGSPQSIALTGTAGNQVSISPASLAFGNVIVGTISSQLTATVTNAGSGTLSSISVSYSGASQFSLVTPTTGSDCRTVGSLAANGQCNIALTFSPNSITAFPGTVSISDSAAGSPQTIAVTGSGAPSLITVSPTSLNFGTVAQGSTSPSQTVSVTVQATPAIFSSVTITGANAADFAIGTNTCTGTVNVSCSTAVTFTPSTTSAESASLNYTGNQSGSPQQVPLSGTGQSTGAATLSPGALAFGSVPIGNTTSQMVSTLTNTGSGTLSSISVSLAGASQFSLVTPSSGTDCRTITTLSAGASCNVAAVFTPNIISPFSSTISISDSAAGSPQTVGLSGAGQNGPVRTIGSPSVPPIP